MAVIGWAAKILILGRLCSIPAIKAPAGKEEADVVIPAKAGIYSFDRFWTLSFDEVMVKRKAISWKVARFQMSSRIIIHKNRPTNMAMEFKVQ